jgi:hypothetical protein
MPDVGPLAAESWSWEPLWDVHEWTAMSRTLHRAGGPQSDADLEQLGFDVADLKASAEHGVSLAGESPSKITFVGVPIGRLLDSNNVALLLTL